MSWASQLYNDLIEHWEKRNIDALTNFLDPRKVDAELMTEMFAAYGNDYLTAERASANPAHDPDGLAERADMLDEFAACGFEKVEDIREQFISNFYFGCEAGDRMVAAAFDPKFHRLGARPKAIFSSDIGHWDAPDMTKVVGEAYELVEDGALNADDFRDFTFGYAAELHSALNPEFFKGTAVEDAVADHVASA